MSEDVAWWIRSVTGKIALTAAACMLGALCVRGQSAQMYTIAQVTSDSINHESPSINDKGQIVWSEIVPVGSALLWQVYETDIRNTNRNAVPISVPDPNHNFQFPAIDNAGDIVYLKDQAGGGAGLQVVENKAGSETIIQFSSVDPNSGAAHVVGKHFGISSNGTLISYFDFCQQSCLQTFDVSGSGAIAGNLIQYFVPVINDNSTFAFVFNRQVCTAPTSDPINSRNCIGSGDLPHITNAQLHFDALTGQIAADPEVVYINGGQVISTFGGVIDSGIWASVNNLGMIVYEKQVNGFNQIFLATPYWQQCHGKQMNGGGHWGGELYAFYPDQTMCGKGCLTTALARAMELNGIANFPILGGIVGNDPSNLNKFMQEQPPDVDYSSTNNVLARATTRDVAFAAGVSNVTWCTGLPLPCAFTGRNIVNETGQVGSTTGASMQAVADLESIVAQNHLPAIVYVTARTSQVFGQHFVLVLGTVGDSTCTSYFDGNSCVDFLISDPFGSPSDSLGNLNTPDKLPYTTLSQYGQNGKFGIYGFVTDPPDVSSLDFAVGDNVSLLVTDAAGRRTGLDPVTGAVLNEIPGSAYFDTSVDDEDIVDVGHVFAPPTPITHQVGVFQPSQGTYSVTLNGVQAGSYVLALRAFSQDGSAQPPVILPGNANSGSVSTTSVQFSPAPGSTLIVNSADKIPPVTVASVSPGPNANGWNNTNVTITLNSTDSEPGGTGVKQITYSATGAQSISSTVVTGASTSFIIGAEGLTTITFFGTDNAGNTEAPNALIIRLDKTPPNITGSASPAPNANRWNNTNVTVSFQCADNLSGLAAGSPPAPTTLSTEGANQSVSGTCMDVAGNSASATVSGINIDETPPAVACSASPNVLWPPNNKLVPVNVSVTVTDTLSRSAGFTLVSVSSSEPDSGQGDIQGFVTGTGATSGQLRAQRLGSGTGRVYTLTYNGADRAGNTASCTTTVTVPHDQGQN